MWRRATATILFLILLPSCQAQQQVRQTARSLGNVSGKVTRADSGAPVAGVIIGLYNDPWIVMGGGPPVPPLGAKTAADGSYVFSGIEPGKYAVQVDQASGFIAGTRFQGHVTVSAGVTATVDIQIKPAGVISGTVLDEEGDPIPGFDAFLYCMDAAGQRANPVYAGEVTTNDRGDFRFASLQPGECYVAVAAASPIGNRPLRNAQYYPAAKSWRDAEPLQVKSGEEISGIKIHIPFTLMESEEAAANVEQPERATPSDESASVSGHAYRDDNGAPLEGVIVRIVPTYDPARPPAGGVLLPEQVARSSEDGAYSFAGLDAGKYTIRADRFGYKIDLSAHPEANSLPPLQISLGERQHMENYDFHFQPTGAISGDIRDQDGVPLKGLAVTVFCGSANQANREPTPSGGTRTDDRGYFRVAGLPGGDCQLGAGPLDAPLNQMGYRGLFYQKATDLQGAQSIHITPGSEIENINFILPRFPAYKVAIKISDPANTPATKYSVVLERAAESALQLANIWGFMPPYPVLAGASGAVFRGITPGTYRIFVTRAVPTVGRDGITHGFSGGPRIGEATINVTNADVTVEIPVSQFPDGGGVD
jgi:hypothetical protein